MRAELVVDLSALVREDTKKRDRDLADLQRITRQLATVTRSIEMSAMGSRDTFALRSVLAKAADMLVRLRITKERQQ